MSEAAPRFADGDVLQWRHPEGDAGMVTIRSVVFRGYQGDQAATVAFGLRA